MKELRTAVKNALESKVVVMKIKQLDMDSPDLSLACKSAIINNDFAKAVELAAMGVKNGDISCLRLWAYLLCGLYKKPEPNCPTVTREQAEKALLVLEEVMCRTGDLTSAGLCALLRFNMSRKGDSQRVFWFKQLLKTASAGCVFAQYYCGRWLIDGNVDDIPQNFDLGLTYLTKCVERKYVASYVYLKKMLKRNPDNRLERDVSELIRLLGFEIDDKGEKVARDSLVAEL